MFPGSQGRKWVGQRGCGHKKRRLLTSLSFSGCIWLVDSGEGGGGGRGGRGGRGG